ncbi:MAG: hypothetical protein IT269_10335 [Saprospiraceae bacterium]|nr:hypothetical protein [Saprospiraceae bacterium]
MRTNKHAMLIACFLLSVLSAFAQRFQKEYHSHDQLYPYEFTETNNAFVIRSTGVATGFIDLTVNKNGNNQTFTPYLFQPPALSTNWFVRHDDLTTLIFNRTNDSQVHARYFAQDSVLQWTKTYPIDGDPSTVSVTGYARDGVRLSDGFLLIGGLKETFPNGNIQHQVFAMKIDFSGNLIWQTRKPTTLEPTWVNKIVLNGGKAYFIWENLNNGALSSYLASITETGIWSPSVQNPAGAKIATGLAVQPNGNILCTGYDENSPPPLFMSILPKMYCYDANWQLLWQKTAWPQMDALSDFANGGLYAPTLVATDGNGWLMGGYIHTADAAPWPYQRSLFIARMDAQGEITAVNMFNSIQSVATHLSATSDGGAALTYYYLNGLPEGGNVGLIKTDANLTAYSNLLKGSSFYDQDVSCDKTPGEIPLTGVLRLTNSVDTFYALTNALGDYSFSADTGDYTVRINPANPYWAPCDNNVAVNFPGENLMDTVDFALQALVECPQMKVEINMPFTRICDTTNIYAWYSNLGTAAAIDARLTVVLQPGMDFLSAQHPLDSIVGDTLYFSMDTVGVLVVGQFSIQAMLNCDSFQLGQTVCVSAHITPDTICADVPGWSGGHVIVGGICEQDSLAFWVKNIGHGPTQSLEYIIIEDMVVWRIDNVAPLNPHETDTIRIPVQGATYGMICKQEPNYPFSAGGFLNNPSAWVEACNWGGGGPFPGGIITQFPNSSGNPAYDYACSVLVGSFDPNDKHAYPEGVGSQHFILPETPLEYTIRFQNTGTDTAFQVVIRDELSTLLEPMTLQILSSSHPVRVEFEDARKLAFEFPGIALPDSNVNLAASQGFVTFSISPKTGLQSGQVINNTANIYFDENEPMATNTWFHTIQSNLINGSTPTDDKMPVVTLEKPAVFPNPAKPGDRLDWLQDHADGRATMFNAWSVPVAEMMVANGHSQVPPHIPPGVYYLKMSGKKVSRLVVLK